MSLRVRLRKTYSSSSDQLANSLPGLERICNRGPAEQAVVTTGDPVNVSTGNAFYHLTDFATAGQSPLQFTPHYNSMMSGANIGATAVTLDADWHSNYDPDLQIGYSGGSLTAVYADLGGWTRRGLKHRSVPV